MELVVQRAIVLVSLSLVGLVIVAGCEWREAESALSRVRAAGKLVIGVDPSYPPFAAIDGQGEPDGFEIDLAREIARELGVAPALVGIDVGSVVDALIARKIDVIISGLQPYPEFAKQLAYSRPYFNAGQVLVVRQGGPAAIEELGGKRVGVESGSTGDIALRGRATKLKGVEIVSYTSVVGAFHDVEAGTIDAVVTDAITSAELLRQHLALTIPGSPFTEEFYVVASRREDEQLVAEISRVLDRLEREGVLGALEVKWLR